MAPVTGRQYRLDTSMSIQEIILLALQLSLIAIVLSVGLQSRFGDLTYMLRRPALLVRAIVAVNVVVPAVAVVLCLILSIPPSTRAGLILMAASPLAASAPLKMLRTQSERSYVVGTYAAVVLSAVVTMPVTAEVLKLVSPHSFKVPMGLIASFVLVNVLAPLVVGVAVNAKWQGLAERVAPVAKTVGLILTVLIVLLIFVKFAREFPPLVGDGTVFVIVATLASGLAAGYALGGPYAANRKTLGEAASTRHPSLAVAIAGVNPQYTHALAVIILFLFCSTLFGLTMAVMRARLQPRPMPRPAAR
jgi:BASS family bile acid:Na+ symporter